MIASLADEQVLKVRGDNGHPASLGYTCAKGRDIPAMHHSPDRLTQPLLRGRAAPWDDVLDDLAAVMREQIDRVGGDGVAGYAGTGLFTDSLGWWSQRRFLDSISSTQNYTSSTVDISPLFKVNELVTGFGWIYPTWNPVDPAPGLVLMFGVNPLVSHGYVGSKLTNPGRQIRDFRTSGGELWVIDPRDTRTARLADRHLAIRPSGDVYVLAWLVREVLAAGADPDELSTACRTPDVERLRDAVARFGLDSAVAHSGLERQDLTDLLAAVRRHRQVAFLPGTGLGFGEFGAVAVWLGLALMIITGSLDRPGGMSYNTGGFGGIASDDTGPLTGHAPVDGHQSPGPSSRPELFRYMGEPPAVALVDEIEAKKVGVFIVGGGNPMTAFPEPDRLSRAVSWLKAFAVIDTYETRLTRRATHVLPSTSQLERADLQSHHRLQLTPAVVAPHPGRRPTWWIFDQLAQRLGGSLFDAESTAWDADAAEAVMTQFAGDVYGGWTGIVRAGTHGVDVPRSTGWVHERVLPDGAWRLAPPVLVERLMSLPLEDARPVRLVCGRTLESNNSLQSTPSKGAFQLPPPIRVSADLAQREGIRSGDSVVVSTERGQLTGRADIDADMAPLTVWVSHGWADQNVSALTNGRDVDPLTGQPIMTGFEVTVSLAGVDAVVQTIDPVNAHARN